VADKRAPQWSDVARNLPPNLPQEKYDEIRRGWFESVLWPFAQQTQGATNANYPSTLQNFLEETTREKSRFPKLELAKKAALAAAAKPVAGIVGQLANDPRPARGLNEFVASAGEEARQQGVSELGVMGSELAGNMVGALPYFLPGAQAARIAGMGPVAAEVATGAIGGGLYEGLSAEPGKGFEEGATGAAVGGAFGAVAGGLGAALRNMRGAGAAAAARPVERARMVERDLSAGRPQGQIAAPPERGLQTMPTPEPGPPPPSVEYQGWANRQLPAASEPTPAYPMPGNTVPQLEAGAPIVRPTPGRPAAGELMAPGESPSISQGRPVLELSPDQPFLQRYESPGLSPEQQAKADAIRQYEATTPEAIARQAENEQRITAFDRTVPEQRGTLEAQMAQLGSGLRRAVLLPSDVEGIAVPRGLRTKLVEGVGKFVYNSKDIAAKEIDAAIKQNRLSEILGAKDGGYGAPDKTKLGDVQMVVVARNNQGVVTQEILTDQANLARTMEQAKKLGVDVQVESVADTLARRQKPALAGSDLFDTINAGVEQNAQAIQRSAGAGAAREASPVGPLPVQRQPTAPVLVGTPTEIIVPNSAERIPARYEIRELADVTPSHSGVDFRPSERYGQTSGIRNDRNYDDDRNRFKIIDHHTRFDARYHFTDDPTPTNGPPVIDGDGDALGGNGRLMTLQRVYHSGGAAMQSYREGLAGAAKKFGLDPASVSTMKQPVLVRVVDDGGLVSSQEAVTLLNNQGTYSLTAEERASSDSRRVGPEFFRLLDDHLKSAGDDASLADALRGKDADELLAKLVADGVFDKSQVPNLFNKNTGITDEGKDRIAMLLLGRILPTPQDFMTTPASLRNRLERIAAPLSQLSQRPDWDLTQAVRDAVLLMEEARGKGIDVETLISGVQESSMIPGPHHTPQAITLARRIVTDRPMALAQKFRQYAGDEKLSRPGEASATMFGEPPTAAESFAAIFEGDVRANTRQFSGGRSEAIAMRDRPTGLQGTTGGAPIPGLPEEVSGATWLQEPGRAATMLREPNRTDQYHESIHRFILEQGIDDAERILGELDPQMSRALAKALPGLSGRGESLYRGVENEEVATRLFTAIRTGDEKVLDAFVKADGSEEEVLEFAAKQAEALQGQLAMRADSPQRRIAERKLQDIRRRARPSLTQMQDDLANMGAEIKAEDGNLYVRENGAKGWRVFEDRDSLIDYLDRKGDWPEVQEFIGASEALPGTGGLPPTGGPRMRFNTAGPSGYDAPKPGQRPRLGSSWMQYWFRPALSWWHDTAKKLGNDVLYRHRVDLDSGAKLAEAAYHTARERMHAVYSKHKIAFNRGHDLFAYQAMRRLEAEGFTGGPTFEAVRRMGRNLNISDAEKAMLDELRPILDDLGREFGITPERWSQEYISVIRKMQTDPDFIQSRYRPPKDLSFFAEQVFAGRSSDIETNFFAVQDTYIRLGYRKKFMEAPYRELFKLVNETKPGESDMTGMLRTLMNRDLEFMRGMPDKSQKAMESAMGSVLEGVNSVLRRARAKSPAWAKSHLADIEMPPQEALRKMVLMQYAGSMGVKPAMWAMNLMQPMLAAPMMDASSFAYGMAKGLGKEARLLAERFNVLAFEGQMGQFLAGDEMVGAAGKIAKAAQFSLEPQRWTDNMTRLITFTGFHKQVTKAIEAFKAIATPGQAELKDFIRRSSMQYLDPMMAEDFASKVAAATGREALEDLAGNIAQRLTETTQWSFTRGAQAGTYKYGVGRLFGMYGTWPTNYVDYVRRILFNPQLDSFERAKTASKFIAVHMGFLKGGEALGINMANQVFLGPAAYGGGPFLTAAQSLPAAVGNWDDDRGDDARRNVLKPMQTMIPGYISGKNVFRAITDDEPDQYMTILKAMGFDTMTAKDEKSIIHKYPEGLFDDTGN
jgi:hypothetical protein